MESRIKELENLVNNLEKRLSVLEKPSNLMASSWSKEEQEYLLQSTINVNPLRPRLLELEEEWPKLFSKVRSIGALRKKCSRLRDK